VGKVYFLIGDWVDDLIFRHRWLLGLVALRVGETKLAFVSRAIA
jgi:hypothetical protein